MNEPSIRSDDSHRSADDTAVPDLDENCNACGSPERAIQAFGLTDIGHRRENNQDQFLIARLNKSMRVDATSLSLEPRLYGRMQGYVMVVADGMGGHAGGARASELAIGYLISRVLDTIHWHFHGEAEEAAFVRSLQRMLQDAHARILMESSQDATNRGMGTTCTMAYVVWPTMYVVHAGDSRCYVVSKDAAGTLHPRQVTTDHTMARRMVESGGMRPEDEATSRWSNVLWNVLGGNTDSEIIADVHRIDLMPGDSVLLCSDGLHRYLDLETVADVIKHSDAPETAARRFVELALSGGGEDNITAVVFSPPDRDQESSTWIDDFELQLGTIDEPPLSDDGIAETASEDLLGG